MITQADVARMREFRKGEIFAMAVGDTMPVIGSENKSPRIKYKVQTPDTKN